MPSVSAHPLLPARTPYVGVSVSRAGKVGFLLPCGYFKPASEDSRDTWMLFMSGVQLPSCIASHQVSITSTNSGV